VVASRSVKGNLVVFAHTSDYRVDVLHRVAKNECVVDVDDDVGGFGGRCTIEEAVIECGHPISFGASSINTYVQWLLIAQDLVVVAPTFL